MRMRLTEGLLVNVTTHEGESEILLELLTLILTKPTLFRFRSLTVRKIISPALVTRFYISSPEGIPVLSLFREKYHIPMTGEIP